MTPSHRMSNKPKNETSHPDDSPPKVKERRELVIDYGKQKFGVFNKQNYSGSDEVPHPPEADSG
jgi:hypothetical protein